MDQNEAIEYGLKLGTEIGYGDLSAIIPNLVGEIYRSINKNVVAEFEAELSETWRSGQQRYYEFVTDKRESYEKQGKKYKITIQEIK